VRLENQGKGKRATKISTGSGGAYVYDKEEKKL